MTYLLGSLSLFLALTPARAAVPTWSCTLPDVYECDEAGTCRKQKAPDAISLQLTAGGLELAFGPITYRGYASVVPAALAPENGFTAHVRGIPRADRPTELLVSGMVSRAGAAQALVAGKRYAGRCE